MKKEKRLDKTSRLIISEMIKDGRVKYTTLAKKLGITPAAVKERVERLIKNKVIRASILLNPKLFFPVTGIIGVEGDSDCINILTQKLRNCPLVISMTKTSGMHNLILHIVAEDMQQLENFLNNQVRSEPGIKHVEVNIGNSSVVPEFYPIRLYNFEDKDHVPCGLRSDDKDVCINCPGLVKRKSK